MKTTALLLLLIVVVSTASAQFKDPFPNFSESKRSIQLPSGIVMKYIEAGDPAGIPVLLIHGYTDTSRSFKLMIMELTKLNSRFRIIAPDLRGHGDSDMAPAEACDTAPETCYSMAIMAADLIDLMNQLNIGQVHVVGHSMGSIVAQTMALQYPERVLQMVLIGALVDGKRNAAIHDLLLQDILENTWRRHLEKRIGFQWPQDAYHLKPQEVHESVDQFIRGVWVAEACAPAMLVEEIYPETMATKLGTWIGALKALGTVDYSQDVEQINIPVLILWATQDNMMTGEAQEKLKAAYARSYAAHHNNILYKTYGRENVNPEQQTADLGHNLHWAAPYEVALDVHQFITTGTVPLSRTFADSDNPQHLITRADSTAVTVVQ